MARRPEGSDWTPPQPSREETTGEVVDTGSHCAHTHTHGWMDKLGMKHVCHVSLVQ